MSRPVEELIRLAMIYGEQDRRSFAEANGSNQVAAEANELADAFRAYRMKRWGRTTMEAQLDRATLTPIDELRRAAQETPAEPVAGVMPGSDLERQIQSARATIAAWPDDVKRAMGVELETSSAPTWRCGICSLLNPDDATHCRQCEYSRMVLRDGKRVPRGHQR